MTRVPKSEVVFTGLIKQLIESNGLLPLAFVFWNAKTERLEIFFPNTFSEEEAKALLASYGWRPIEPVGE